MALDPELRAYLDGIRSEMTTIRADIVAVEERAVARDAATRETLEAKIDATRAEAAATRETLEAKIDATRAEAAATRETLEAKIDATRETLEAKIEGARREAGAMMESIIHEIRVLPEGLSTFQRQEADRLDAVREKEMLNRHVLPLEASAANHEKRIKAVEQHR